MNFVYKRSSDGIQIPPCFSALEQRVLKLIQANFPLSPTPFADIARCAGCTEKFVLDLIQKLLDCGIIRRIGASIQHVQAGYSHNALLAFEIAEGKSDLCGEMVAGNEYVSHCYLRSSPDKKKWPYELYAMIHARDESALNRTVTEIYGMLSLCNLVLRPPLVLRTLKEFKKISIQPF